jgi:DNA-binding transcriptional ArsR family regulator
MTVQVIDDPEKVKILLDETRNKMICMLAKGSMSLSQLARALNRTPATVFYHIKKLASVDLIKLEKTRVVNNNLVEKYYSLAFPSSCLISLRVAGPERAPVPPKKSSKIDSRGHKLCPDICWDDVFATLEVKLKGNNKQRLIEILNQILERATFEAGEAYREATQQINMRLSSQDQRKLQQLASAIPIITFCKIVEKPENLKILKDLLRSLSTPERNQTA